MIRLIYSTLFYLAQPLVWFRLAWRARKQPEYLQHIGERYGLHDQACPARLIWLHAVSVGETRAAEPLIKGLLSEYPDHSLLMTHMTPTGRAVGGELIGKYGPRLIQAYLPYDLPDACSRFLDYFKPRLGLLMETEIWPNLIAATRQRKIPILLVNARLSSKSQHGYQRFLPLIRPALGGLACIAAQTSADSERLKSIGAVEIHITGNLKFDVTPAPEKLQLGAEWRRLFGDRRVWLAASTREGEEPLILDAFSRLDLPGLLLVLVPRHPQRFNEVAAMLEERKLPFCRRSDGAFPAPETRVWLGDSMGEMPAYFAAADLSLIGGTLLPFGGQNLIEAAACGCPVLVGPHTFNFAQATEDALACGAAQRVTNAADAAACVKRLLADTKALQTMHEMAVSFSQEHRGATARTMALIREFTAPRTTD